MLDGTVTFIDGAHRIAQLHDSTASDPKESPGDLVWDDDLHPFLVIYAKTLSLPSGKLAALFNHAALAALQPERDLAEVWARDLGRPACHNLIRRYS
jgi:hypothetical protein